MAEVYVTLNNLAKAMDRYDKTFKVYTDDRIKDFIKAITYDQDEHKLKFYTVPAPVPEGTVPYLEVDIGSSGQDFTDLFGVSMEEAVAPETGKYKTYVFYQGEGNNKTEIGKISLEYDTVVESGSVVTATAQNPIVVGSTEVTEGKYLRLVIKNNAVPVYIALSDIGAVYKEGDGIRIANDATISINIDENNSNGLVIDSNGIGLNLAVAPDPEHNIAGSAGAISAEDKAVLDNFSIATDSQIRSLFE